MKFGVFICFAIGAVAIGLVLLDHEPCSGNEGGSGDAHAGHDGGLLRRRRFNKPLLGAASSSAPTPPPPGRDRNVASAST